MPEHPIQCLFLTKKKQSFSNNHQLQKEFKNFIFSILTRSITLQHPYTTPTSLVVKKKITIASNNHYMACAVHVLVILYFNEQTPWIPSIPATLATSSRVWILFVKFLNNYRTDLFQTLVIFVHTHILHTVWCSHHHHHSSLFEQQKEKKSIVLPFQHPCHINMTYDLNYSSTFLTTKCN